MEPPCGYLFSNGNAVFFDEHQQQIPEFQSQGWNGLVGFYARYPDAPVEAVGGVVSVPDVARMMRMSWAIMGCCEQGCDKLAVKFMAQDPYCYEHLPPPCPRCGFEDAANCGCDPAEQAFYGELS